MLVPSVASLISHNIMECEHTKHHQGHAHFRQLFFDVFEIDRVKYVWVSVTLKFYSDFERKTKRSRLSNTTVDDFIDSICIRSKNEKKKKRSENWSNADLHVIVGSISRALCVSVNNLSCAFCSSLPLGRDHSNWHFVLCVGHWPIWISFTQNSN